MTEKELFEEWFSAEFPVLYATICDKRGHPATMFFNNMWQAWQASANREGFKLVPVVLTNRMAHAAKSIDGRLSSFKYGDVYKAMIGACDDNN